LVAVPSPGGTVAGMSSALRRRAAAFLAVFAVVAAVAGATAARPAGAPAGAQPTPAEVSAIYGVDDANVIWEADPELETFVAVNATGLPGVSNAMAYDAERDQFLFINRPLPTATDRLYLWDRSSTGPGSLRQVANYIDMLLPSTQAQPANAAFYNDAYWFFPNYVPATYLSRLSFTYVDGVPTEPSLTVFNLGNYAAPLYEPGFFGDIAVSPDGVLYGAQSNGRFFRIDLDALGSTGNAVYTELKAPGVNPSLQLSFDGNGEVLYGHEFETGAWFTVDLASGDVTPTGFTSLVPDTGTGFRDVGGASMSNAATGCEMADPDASDNQTAEAGSAVPNPLEVLVVDVNGNPVEGVEVVFSVESGGGTLDGEGAVTALSGTDGVASVSPWVLGGLGANTVLAGVAGLCEVLFTATATPVSDPAVSLDKALLGDPDAVAGSPVAWELVATNTGDVALSDVTVTDDLTGDVFNCGELAPGGSCTFEVTYTLTQADVDAGVLVNTASVEGVPPAGGAVSDDAEAELVLAGSPAVAVTKVFAQVSGGKPSGSVVAGDVLEWAVSVANTGNVTLTSVSLDDPLAGADGVVCAGPLAPLAPGASVACVARTTVTAEQLTAGQVVNDVSVVGSPASGPEVADDAQAVFAPSGAASALLAKSFLRVEDDNGDGFVQPGERLVWLVQVTNVGSVALSEVTVTDDLTGDVLSCPTLAPGESCSMEVAYAVTAVDLLAGRVVNVAALTARGADGSTVAGDVTSTAQLAVPPAPPGPPAPQPPAASASLPVTGASPGGLLGWAAALLVAGGLAVAGSRRLRRADAH
jgi:hypothetical protein